MAELGMPSLDLFDYLLTVPRGTDQLLDVIIFLPFEGSWCAPYSSIESTLQAVHLLMFLFVSKCICVRLSDDQRVLPRSANVFALNSTLSLWFAFPKSDTMNYYFPHSTEYYVHSVETGSVK
jgi:hypothetical protein